MAADVAQNAAVFGPLVEPRGAGGGIADAVRPEAENLHDLADGTAGDELGGEHGGFDVEPFAEIDGVFLGGAGDHGFGRVELLERRERSLVREVILAGLHHAAAKRAAITGDGGGGDHVHGAIGEDLIERAGNLDLRIFCPEGFHFLYVGIVDPLQIGAGFEQTVALAVDVAVVEVDGSESEFAGFDHRTWFALRCV